VEGLEDDCIERGIWEQRGLEQRDIGTVELIGRRTRRRLYRKRNMVRSKETANPTHVTDRYTGNGTFNIVNCWERTGEHHKGELEHRNGNIHHGLIKKGTEGT
nr:hypothetical protein [Tanacetum cinerariifolium]